MTQPTLSFLAMQYLCLAGLVVVSTFGNGLANAGQIATPMIPKAVTERDELRQLRSWSEIGLVDVVAQAVAGSAPRVERVTVRVVTYRPSPGMALDLSAITTDEADAIYIIRGGHTFYIHEKGEMLGCTVSAGGVTIGKSVFRYPKESGGVSDAIEKFVDGLNDQGLPFETTTGDRIDLRPGAPLTFFTADSRMTSQIGIPTVTSLDLNGDMLTLGLQSPGGRHAGRFWIDLSKRRLIRSIVDGKETVIPL